MRRGENTTVHLIEISYTQLTNIRTRAHEKQRKYTPTLEELESHGWKPVLHTIILGTLGEITTDTSTTLQQLGVTGRHLKVLLEDLHKIAINGT